MTCIEKLKELYPEYGEEDIKYYMLESCPGAFMEVTSPPYCDFRSYSNCERCWNEEYKEPIPHEFEFWRRDTLEVNGGVVESTYTKMHMTVLERIKQRYTGELVYRIRRQSEEGWIDEDFYTEKEVQKMSEARIDG